MSARKPDQNISFRHPRWISVEVMILILGVALIFATLEVSRRELIPFVTAQRDLIIAVEAAIVSILLIELVGRIIVAWFQEHGVRAYGIYVRTIIRIAGYLVAVVAIISILAANPALAISVGTITGVIIGFASQNVTGNALAAVLLIASRTVRAGDTITVAGNTGEVIDITLIYTVIDTETGRVFVPNVMMVTTAVQRRKKQC